MAVTQVSDLNGLFKEVYGDSIMNLVPDNAKFIKMVPFSEEEKIGKLYHQPVALTYEHGYTYGAPGDGAFTLRAAIPMKMQDAQVDGYQGVLRAQMDYETAAKAVSKGAKSFEKATRLQVTNMMDSMTKRVELSILYGQSGVGAVSSSTNQSATQTLVQFTTASWATGIWAGMENAALNFFKQSDGSLVSSSTDAIFTIDKVDVANRRIYVTGTTTGISALDTAIGLGACDVFFDTARTAATTFKEMVGINKIITNTGTLFNISADTYQLWKGNTFDCGSAALTLSKIISGLAVACGRGLDEKVTVFLNDRTWGNVASDQSALRKYDANYNDGKATNGFRSITFYSQNGEVELIPYNCIKEGEAFALPMKRLKRVGASDITFNSLGGEGNFFRELSDNAGFEYRAFQDQSIFIETPARCVKFTNIVNA